MELDRKRLEAEKKKKIASVSKSKIITRKGSLIKYENGILYDTETNLEWVAGPDKGTTWSEAKSWVSNLSLDGGGWRIPEKEEVKNLLRGKTKTIKQLFHFTDSLYGFPIWATETKNSLSKSLVSTRHTNYPSYPFDHRAVAARPRR